MTQDEQHMQHEQLRRHCLQVLGISVYLPRKVLPGAKNSPVVVELPPLARAPEQVEPLVPMVEEEVEEDTQVAPLQVPPASDMVSGPELSTEETQREFRMLLLRVDRTLAVLCQVPVLGKAQLQAPQARLLRNLLQWLGRAQDAQAAPREFLWPPPGLALTAVATAAGTGLGLFLEQACLEQPFRHLLVLSEHAAECLAAARSGDKCSWQPVCVHGLDEMLALPHLKRETWLQLLPLQAALRDAAAAVG